MKLFLTLIIIAALAFGGWKLIQTKPAADVPQAVVTETTAETSDATVNTTSRKIVDNTNVKVSFKGFGPGKQHVGAFANVTSNLASSSATGAITGVISVDMNSLSTDNDKVTAHLKTADFFDTTKYPTATFTLVSLSDTTATGSFAIHGMTKQVTFPVTKTATEYTATFTLDMKEFGIDQTFANETIELSVVVPIK